MFPALRVFNLGQGPIKGPKWILWFDARLSTHFLNFLFFHWQLMVCGCSAWVCVGSVKNFLVFFFTGDCGVLFKAKTELSAISWSSTHFYSSSSSSAPFRLSYLHTPHLLLPSPPPSCSFSLLHTRRLWELRRQTLGDSEPLWALDRQRCRLWFCCFYLCTFLGFQREPRAEHQRRSAEELPRTEPPQAGMAGWCCSCCFGNISQHPIHKTTL